MWYILGNGVTDDTLANLRNLDVVSGNITPLCRKVKWSNWEGDYD
jgi:hypothetical protein